MGRPTFADVRREIALETLAEWLGDLLRSYPRAHVPCQRCVHALSTKQMRRRLKQRGYQARYRERKRQRALAKKEAS